MTPILDRSWVREGRTQANLRGPKDPNNGAPGPKYYDMNGNWPLKPFYLGPIYPCIVPIHPYTSPYNPF